MAAVVPFIPLIVAAASAAATGVELSRMPSSPKAPTQTNTISQQAQAQQAAALAQAHALAQRRGQASTILTSPQGIQNSPTTTSATLGA